MRRTRISAGNWLIYIGMILAELSIGTPAHARETIDQQLEKSGGVTIHNGISDATQREAIFKLLDEAMVVLRDNKPFNPDSAVIGKIMLMETEHGYPGGIYYFRNEALHPARIVFSTGADPLDYSEDRMKAPVVPAHFEIFFTASLPIIDRSLLERRLDLSDYWIDHGVKRQGNDMGRGYAPQNRIHAYRYRANNHANTRVPVDVELDYIDPEHDDPSSVQELSRIVIDRAYPILTPEQRKQKHEEKE